MSRAAAAVGAAPASSAQRRLRCRWVSARSRAPRCRSACPQACSATARATASPRLRARRTVADASTTASAGDASASRSASWAASRHDRRCTSPSLSREGCGVNGDSQVPVSHVSVDMLAAPPHRGSCAGGRRHGGGSDGCGRARVPDRRRDGAPGPRRQGARRRYAGGGGQRPAGAHARDAGERGRGGPRARGPPAAPTTAAPNRRSTAISTACSPSCACGPRTATRAGRRRSARTAR